MASVALESRLRIEDARSVTQKVMRVILPLFLAITAVPIAVAQSVQCPGPLSEKQIIDLIQGKVPDGRVQSSVTSCGINFSPTEETLARLREAGATSVVLVTVRRKGEQQSWEVAKNSRTSEPVEEFLRTYPNSQFAAEAREKLNTLRAEVLRGQIRRAVAERQWDGVQSLPELRTLVPEDDEIRSWTRQVTEARARLERERLEAETERQRALEAERVQKEKEEEEQKNRAAEARLADLRRKIGLEGAAPGLKANLTLAEARQQLAALRGKILDIETRLKMEHPQLQESQNTTKGTFETTPEYQARLAEQKQSRAEALQRYAKDFADLTSNYYEQIAGLLTRQYPAIGVKVTLMNYDADHQILYAKLGNYSYRFSVAREKAPIFYEHQNGLEVQGNLLKSEEDRHSMPDEILLIDALSGERLESNGVSADVSGTWTAKIPYVNKNGKVDRGYSDQLTFSFVVGADGLTGTVEAEERIEGGRKNPWVARISDGEVKGDAISFVVSHRNVLKGSSSLDIAGSYVFRGTLSGKQINFTRASDPPFTRDIGYSGKVRMPAIVEFTAKNKD